MLAQDEVNECLVGDVEHYANIFCKIASNIFVPIDDIKAASLLLQACYDQWDALVLRIRIPGKD